MTKEKLRKILKQAREEGANDNLLHDLVHDHADEFISSEVFEELTDEEHEAIVKAYSEGHYNS